MVCSSASALLALSLLTAIPIRKPEPGGKWRDCIDTTDHWAPDNWQLFLSFTSGDGLNRLYKIWWLPKKERRVGEETEASYCLAPSLPGTKGSVEQCSRHRKQKWKIHGSEQIRWFEGMFVQKSKRLNVLRPLLSLQEDATGFSPTTKPSTLAVLWQEGRQSHAPGAGEGARLGHGAASAGNSD